MGVHLLGLDDDARAQRRVAAICARPTAAHHACNFFLKTG